MTDTKAPRGYEHDAEFIGAVREVCQEPTFHELFEMTRYLRESDGERIENTWKWARRELARALLHVDPAVVLEELERFLYTAAMNGIVVKGTANGWNRPTIQGRGSAHPKFQEIAELRRKVVDSKSDCGQPRPECWVSRFSIEHVLKGGQ